MWQSDKYESPYTGFQEYGKGEGLKEREELLSKVPWQEDSSLGRWRECASWHIGNTVPVDVLNPIQENPCGRHGDVKPQFPIKNEFTGSEIN